MDTSNCSNLLVSRGSGASIAGCWARFATIWEQLLFSQCCDLLRTANYDVTPSSGVPDSSPNPPISIRAVKVWNTANRVKRPTSVLPGTRTTKNRTHAVQATCTRGAWCCYPTMCRTASSTFDTAVSRTVRVSHTCVFLHTCLQNSAFRWRTKWYCTRMAMVLPVGLPVGTGVPSCMRIGGLPTTTLASCTKAIVSHYSA